MLKKQIKFSIKILTIMVLITSHFSPLITFAQTTSTNQCQSCGTTPAQFDNYENFVKTLLANMQTIGTKGEYTGLPVSPSWFQSKIFEIPKENQFTLNKLVSGITQRIKKTANIFWATTAIMFSLWRELITKDGVWWFLILFKQRTFVETWRRLLDLDSLIHQKMFDLGLAWAFTEKISPQNRQYLQQIINQYIKTTDNPDALFDQAQLYDWIKYYQITEMLLRINSAMKTFVSYNTIKQFNHKEFQKWLKDTKFIIQFNFEQISQMQSQYQCARWIKWLKNCNKAFKKFAQNIKKITWENIKWAKASLNTINTANKKFKNAFSVAGKQLLNKDLTKDEQKFLDKEKDLLRTLYWQDADKMINNGFFAKINKFRSTSTKWDNSLLSEQEQDNIKQNVQNIKDEAQKNAQTIIDGYINKEKRAFEKNRIKQLQECLKNIDKKERKELIKTISIYTKKDPSIKKQITSCEQIDAIVNNIKIHQYTDKNITTISHDKMQDIIAQWNPKANINPELLTIFTKSMETLINHQQDYSKQMVLADNKDLTLFFSEIFTQIHTTKQIIWTKEEGLLNNLSTACELQCENKPWQCSY